MLFVVFNVLFSLLAITLIVLFTVFWFNETGVTLRDAVEEAKEKGNLIPLLLVFLATVADTLLSIFMVALIFRLLPSLWWLAVGLFVIMALISLAVYYDW